MKYEIQCAMTRTIITSTHLVKILPVANSVVQALAVRGIAEECDHFLQQKIQTSKIKARQIGKNFEQQWAND